MATVDIHYLKAALRCAERKQISSGRLLAEIGVSPSKLEEPNSRIHGDQMSRLVQLIWSELRDEFMGCTAHPCKPGAFAFMARHVLHYDSLEAALRQGLHFYNLFTDDIRMRFQRHKEMAVIEVEFVRPELDPDHFYQEFWLVIWHRFASWITGRKIPLQRVNFTYAKPDYYSELKYLFPCRHQFNRPVLQLSFSAELLTLPLVRSQRDLSDFLRHSPADLITIPGEERSYRGRIRSRLLQQHRGVLNCPSLVQMADDFGMSAQTLRRKLKGEGTTYPRIKDEIRRDLAVEKLMAQKLPVSEIARQLGFSEPRSFTRAFRHWTGLTPTEYSALKISRARRAQR